MRLIRAALWLLLAVGLMGQATPTATPTPVAPPSCTLTGVVVNPDGSPFVNGTINFNSKSIQVISGWPVYPTIVNTNTDASGNIVAVALPQGLVMQVTICPGKQQAANCSAPFSAIVPFTTTGSFGQMAQGINLTGAAAFTGLSVSGATSLAATTINPTLLLSNTTNASVYWGSLTTPVASINAYGSRGLNIAAGAHNNGSNWIADAATATIESQENLGSMGYYYDSGLTVGSPYTPTELGWWGASGLNIAAGKTLYINGQNLIQSGTFTPTIAGSGSNPTVTYAGQVGYWAQVGPIAYYYLRVTLSAISGGSGNVLFSFSGAGVPQCGTIGGSTEYALGTSYGNGLALTSGYTQVMSQVPSSTYTLTPVQSQPNGTAPQAIPLSQVASFLDYLTNWTCRVY